ncbi:hypothetical protein Tco_0862760 [Tanacetum coccineum]
MPIPKDLITDAIQNSEYYKKYLEMAARKPRQPTTMTSEEVKKKKKALKAGKSTQPVPAKQPKPAKKKTSKPTPSNKIRKGKRSNHLVEEADEEPQPASELQMEDDEYNLYRGIQMSLESLQAPVGGVRRTPVTPDASTRPSAQPHDDTSADVVHDTSSPVDSPNDAENAADMQQSNSKNDTKILNDVEEQVEEVSNMVALEERNFEFNEGHAGSGPGKTLESRPPPEEDQAGSDPGQSHVAQAGPNPEPMHEDFISIVYPKVHESLKLTTEKQVHIENPPSSSKTLSSMKNLKDAFTFASSSVPPLSTPIIDLSPPKLASPPVQEPIFTTTTTTTTTIPSPPPPPLQSTTDPDLAIRVSVLEKRSADFDQKNKLQEKETQALASRVYKLENHHMYSKIDKQVNEVVKEDVHNALQAPLRERFRDLSEFQMKEILHDRMFESNSYRSHPDYTTLYEALEVSMQRENNDELHTELTKSRKRCRDDQDPPPPPPKDSDRSKKKKHDFDVSASKQPPF